MSRKSATSKLVRRRVEDIPPATEEHLALLRAGMRCRSTRPTPPSTKDHSDASSAMPGAGCRSPAGIARQPDPPGDPGAAPTAGIDPLRALAGGAGALRAAPQVGGL